MDVSRLIPEIISSGNKSVIVANGIPIMLSSGNKSVNLTNILATAYGMKITGCQVSNLYAQALVTLDPCEWMNNKTTTIAYCYRICRTDGKVLGFTSHDQDITFDGTTYKANTGFTPTTVDTSNEMSSDNLDATMPLTSDEITVEDLENGLYDFAEFIVYSVNWKDLSDDKLILRRGTLGRVAYKDRDFTDRIS